jgi:hypothetical protein
MAATFVCPHCGYSYPMKPVLVGRAVRCTGCKQAFQLRADGIADKVAPPVEAPAAAKPAAPAPSPPAAPSVPTPKPAARPADAGDKVAASRAAKLTRQQEDARRAMAGTLASAANLALQAESKKQDTAKADKQAKRSGKDGVAGKITAAAVVGEGDRAHRSRRIWLLSSGAVIAVIATLVTLGEIKSPEQQALLAFTIDETDFRKHHTERIQSIQDRALLPGSIPLVDVGKLRVGKPRKIALAAARTVIAEQIKTLVYVPSRDLWAPEDKLEDIEVLWKPRSDLEANVAMLAGKQIQVLPHRSLLTKLAEAGLPEEDVGLLMKLMFGKTNDGGLQPPLSKRLLSGQLPDAIEIAPFRGTKGTMLMNTGRENRLRPVEYQGRLLRFIGTDWPTGWRVLDVVSVGD